MKKFLAGIAAVITVLTIFGAGALANQWMINFDGEESIEGSSEDVNEILDILKKVNDEKITAEEALAEFDKLDIEGLQSQLEKLEGTVSMRDFTITGLEEQIKTLSTEKNQFETNLSEVNEENENLNNKLIELTEQNESLSGTVIELRDTNSNSKIEKDELIGKIELQEHTIEGLMSDLEEAKESQADQDYIAHLESELEKANISVSAHKQDTSNAVEEAKNIVNNSGE